MEESNMSYLVFDESIDPIHLFGNSLNQEIQIIVKRFPRLTCRNVYGELIRRINLENTLGLKLLLRKFPRLKELLNFVILCFATLRKALGMVVKKAKQFESCHLLEIINYG